MAKKNHFLTSFSGREKLGKIGKKNNSISPFIEDINQAVILMSFDGTTNLFLNSKQQTK
jgi:hypothetical protein